MRPWLLPFICVCLSLSLRAADDACPSNSHPCSVVFHFEPDKKAYKIGEDMTATYWIEMSQSVSKATYVPKSIGLLAGLPGGVAVRVKGPPHAMIDTFGEDVFRIVKEPAKEIEQNYFLLEPGHLYGLRTKLNFTIRTKGRYRLDATYHARYYTTDEEKAQLAKLSNSVLSGVFKAPPVYIDVK